MWGTGCNVFCLCWGDLPFCGDVTLSAILRYRSDKSVSVSPWTHDGFKRRVFSQEKVSLQAFWFFRVISKFSCYLINAESAINITPWTCDRGIIISCDSNIIILVSVQCYFHWRITQKKFFFPNTEWDFRSLTFDCLIKSIVRSASDSPCT